MKPEIGEELRYYVVTIGRHGAKVRKNAASINHVIMDMM